MEDTVTLEVKLRGGEALFVTPISRNWCDKNNKFHIYDTLEFSPTIPWQLKIGNYGERTPYLRFWFTKITRAIKAFLETFPDNIKEFTGSNVFNSWFSNRTWYWGKYHIEKELSNDWFYAVDIFKPEPLHINGNIEVGSSEYIDWSSSYPPPSSLWIEERLRERFHVWTFDKEEDKIAEEKFWKWRQEQIDKGYKVYYITSLET